MRLLLITFVLSSVPGLALAHPGHLTDLAGHDHWVAGAAIGVAVVLGAWTALKGRRKSDRADAAGEDDTVTEPQDA
ncbi:MAG: hypothetical protein KDA50_13920 [Rhodobacteraceae bacterium]|nr:hypothetical protein [Paracoccaceae bacterium]